MTDLKQMHLSKDLNLDRVNIYFFILYASQSLSCVVLSSTFPYFLFLNLGQFQNSTLEERVELLEGQVVVIQDEIVDLDEDVDFLFDEQVIQDERLLNLEETTNSINAELVSVDDEIEGTNYVEAINTETDFSIKHIGNSKNMTNRCHFVNLGLQDTTLALDFRVTVLEENGGDDGNSSVAELEMRVETLEETAADHETRISETESELTGICAIKCCCLPLGRTLPGKLCAIPTRCKISKIHQNDHTATLKHKNNNSNVLLKLTKRFHNYVLILDLDETVTDQETRLTAAEENIQGTSIRCEFQ